MALKAYALTTIARFKTFAGITTADHDTLLTDLVNIVTELIERYCKRRFKQTAYTNELLDSDGAETLFLGQYPVSSSASFTLEERNSESNEDDWDTIDSEDYFVDYDSGIIHRAGREHWRVGKQAYRVSYTAGYNFDNAATYLADTTAGDLEYIVWKIVKTIFDRRQSQTGITSESLGDYSVSFNAAVMESDEIKEVLDKYAKNETVGTTSPFLY